MKSAESEKHASNDVNEQPTNPVEFRPAAKPQSALPRLKNYPRQP